MKIIFLDFDGVISTNRAWIAQEHIKHFDMRWLDPIACGLIAKLCARYDYKIVVTSTWRKYGYERVSACLSIVGLFEYLHDDWCTQDLWSSGSSSGSRPLEIDAWLLDNSDVTDYLIIDDDSFDWTDQQRNNWIKTNQLDGFSTLDFEKVININGGQL